MNNIKILLSVIAYQKLRHWTDFAQGEVSGLGTVTEIKSNGTLTGFLIEDVYLLKQKSSSADTTLDNEAVGQFLLEMTEKGEDLSKIKLWWHSHGSLDTFWSTTDEQCIKDLTNSSYMISLVVNKAGKMLGRIDIYKPFQVTVKDLPIQIYYPEDEHLKEFCLNEFKQKVTESFFVHHAPHPFPGRDELDDQIENLEEMLNRGVIGYDEYEQRMWEIHTRDAELMEEFE